MGHPSTSERKRLVLTVVLSVSVPEEAEDPACIPIFWVSKWVDYSDKYGLGRFLPGGWVARDPPSCYRHLLFLTLGSSSLNTLLSASQAS